MSDYGQVTKSHTFQDFAKFVFWLHTERRRAQIHPAHPSASNFHDWRSEHSQKPPRQPPDTPQIAPGNMTCQQTPTDANRHRQTPPDTERCCLSMSGCVCWRLWSSVGMLCSLKLSGGCLGDVWVVSGSVVSSIRGNWRRSDALGCFWVLYPCSMQPK